MPTFHRRLLYRNCVYTITNIYTGACYIGATTVTLRARCYEHIALLRAGKHYSRPMQADFDVKGEEAFAVRVLEMAPDRESLPLLERYWIDCCLRRGVPIYNGNPKVPFLDLALARCRNRADYVKHRDARRARKKEQP